MMSKLLICSLSAASALQAATLLRAPVAPVAQQRPMLLGNRAAAQLLRMAETEEYPTLEEELEAGRITQEEYDALNGGEGAISEEEYEAEQVIEGKAAEEDLSEDAKRVLRGMKSSTGVEFAPWMKVDPEAIAKAKADREARKARAAQGMRSDAMLIDPQAAELGAGGGLNSKVLSEEEIELRWDTQDEAGNAGFIVQRRKGGSENFVDLATYEDFAPLRTKGPAGGSYVYLDDEVNVGTWVYRILDCDTSGTRSAVCQKLVEIDSEAEGKQTIFVGVLIAGLALAFVAGGLLLDPIQTTQNGAKIF